MVSPFSLFVARGSNVPARDRRLDAHVRARVVVGPKQETATQEPAQEPPVEALERQATDFEKETVTK